MLALTAVVHRSLPLKASTTGAALRRRLIFRSGAATEGGKAAYQTFPTRSAAAAAGAAIVRITETVDGAAVTTQIEAAYFSAGSWLPLGGGAPPSAATRHGGTRFRGVSNGDSIAYFPA